MSLVSIHVECDKQNGENTVAPTMSIWGDQVCSHWEWHSSISKGAMQRVMRVMCITLSSQAVSFMTYCTGSQGHLPQAEGNKNEWHYPTSLTGIEAVGAVRNLKVSPPNLGFHVTVEKGPRSQSKSMDSQV